MSFRYYHHPHLAWQHRQPLLEDDYHHYTLPPQTHRRPSSSRLHDQYDHDQRYYPDYERPLPKRKSSTRRHKLARSSSTGNLQREYDDQTEDEDDRDYREPRHRYERRRRNSSCSDDEEPRQQQRTDAKGGIDLDNYSRVDGEPMNALEILAAINAHMNKKKSRVLYPEEIEEVLQQLDEANIAPIQQLAETEEEEEDEENVTNMLDSLTMSDSNASTVVEPIVDDIKDQLPPSPSLLTQKQKTKKKRWPFGFLFKKPTMNTSSSAKTQQRHEESVKTTSSSPPTPVLTPDTFTNSNISSSTNTITSQHQILPHGVWAFRAPMTQIWCRFDDENQRKIHDYMNLPNGVLYITDSHFGGGQVPLVMLPFQKICYYPTNLNLMSLSYLEMSFSPYNIGGTLY